MLVNKRSIKGTQTNWIKMQTETFINWININLSSRDMAITDIETAFEDGVKLVNLFEVISKRTIGKYAKNPKFHTQKMENVALVLKEMELDGVKVVSIDSDCVVKGNFKMLLGLIWQLILRYQVGGSDPESVKINIKKLLLLWMQHVIPDQNIRNLTTDWNSGIALCNLINVLQPGLCPEYSTMVKHTPVENVTKGLELAAEAFGIPQIISPEYMASPNVDDLSMTTYLSYFTQDGGIGEKWTSNLITAWNPAIEINGSFTTVWSDGHALCQLVNTFAQDSIDESLLSDDHVENCRLVMDVAREKFGVQQIIKPEEMANPKVPELACMAYLVQFSKLNESGRFLAGGQGLQEAKLNEENEFIVSYPKDTIVEHLNVVVLNPNNQMIKLETKEIDSKVRRYTYIPEESGNYTINISYDGKQISKSPYLVHVLAIVDPHIINGEKHTDTKLYSELNEKIGISVDTSKSGKGELTVSTIGPDDIEYPTDIKLEDNGTNTVFFTPKMKGKYSSIVKWNGKPIPQSPFYVLVSDSSKCVPKEPITCKGRVKKKTTFDILTLEAGPGFVTSYAEYSLGHNTVEVTVTQQEEGCYSCCFTPDEPGEYILHVNYSDCPIRGSPFDIIIYDRPKVSVSIDSDIGGESFKPFSFVVNILDEDGIGELLCFVSGPQDECILNELVKEETGFHECFFTPLEAGAYKIDVYYRSELVENSPYTVYIYPPPVCELETIIEDDVIEILEDSSTKLYADVDEEIGISVDTRKSCEGTLTASCICPETYTIHTEIHLETNGTHTISFTPHFVGKYETNIFWNDKEIFGSPFAVWVSDPKKCIVKEPTITLGLINSEITFEVLTTAAGIGTLTSNVECYEIEDVEVSTLEEGHYKCTFNPTKSGEYSLSINFKDTPIIGSPYNILVCDPDNVYLSLDPDLEIETDLLYTFDVNFRDKIGYSTLKCIINGPDQNEVESDIKWDEESLVSYVSFYPFTDGCYTVTLLYAGVSVNNSPFNIHSITTPPSNPPDASKVVVTGDDLSECFVGDSIKLSVDVTHAGIGELYATSKGVNKNIVEVIKNGENIYEIAFTPDVSGQYLLDIIWDAKHIPGSPFIVIVKDRTYPEKVILDGKGLKEGIAGQQTLISVDGRNAGPGQIHCKCRAPSGKVTTALMTDNLDGTQTIDLNPKEPGLHTLDLKWGPYPITGSPFIVKILIPSDSTKVHAYGPGLIPNVYKSFRGIFHVDTKRGGAGALKVRVNGPKKCFKVEMYRNNPKDRVINVQYNPTLPGIYTVNVFWSDKHIPGSPFEVFVAAKDSHLEKWNKTRREVLDDSEQIDMYSGDD